MPCWQVTDFDATIGLFEDRDDLCLGESFFFHRGAWSDPCNLDTLLIRCRAIEEVGIGRRGECSVCLWSSHVRLLSSEMMMVCVLRFYLYSSE